MTYETNMTKGYNGWNARSIVSLGQTSEGERVLELNTYKYRDGIAAQASVFIYKTDGSKVTEIFGDYSKSGIAQTPLASASPKKPFVRYMKLRFCGWTGSRAKRWRFTLTQTTRKPPPPKLNNGGAFKIMAAPPAFTFQFIKT